MNSMRKKYKRLWEDASADGIDNNLINLLGRLNVFGKKKWAEYVEDCQRRIIEARYEQMRRMTAHIDHTPPQYNRAPKSIKPTRSRSYK